MPLLPRAAASSERCGARRSARLRCARTRSTWPWPRARTWTRTRCAGSSPTAARPWPPGPRSSPASASEPGRTRRPPTTSSSITSSGGSRPSCAGTTRCSTVSASWLPTRGPRAGRRTPLGRRRAMTVRELRLLGDPVLRTECDPVTRFDDAVGRLVDDLLENVLLPGRAGLAAPQIGVSLAAFSYNVDGQHGCILNPVIAETSGECDGPEGCLSIPGLTADTPRALRTVVAGVDRHGDPV